MFPVYVNLFEQSLKRSFKGPEKNLRIFSYSLCLEIKAKPIQTMSCHYFWCRPSVIWCKRLTTIRGAAMWFRLSGGGARGGAGRAFIFSALLQTHNTQLLQGSHRLENIFPRLSMTFPWPFLVFHDLLSSWFSILRKTMENADFLDCC